MSGTDLPPDARAATERWRHAVVYEAYLRSFADGDGDGIGDIAGIRSRLPYLRGHRQAIALRRGHPGLAGPAFGWLGDDATAPHFEREGGFRCLVNLGCDPLPLRPGSVVLLRSDGPAAAGPLPRDAAAWYLAR